MRKLLKYIFVLPATIMVIAGCGVEKKEVRLAFRFQAGQVLQYSDQVKATSQFGGAPEVSSQGGDLSFQAAIEEKVISVDSNSNGRVKLTDFIVSSPEENVASNRNPQAEKWSIEYLMSPAGKVIDIFPQDSLSASLTAFYKNYYEQALPVFPEHPVSEGYSWTQSVRVIVKGEGITRAETTYRIKSFVREAGYDCAVIQYKGNMILPLQTSESEGGVSSRLERINSEGVMYFGYILGAIVKQEETVTARVEGTRMVNGKSKPFTASTTRFNSMILTKLDM